MGVNGGMKKWVGRWPKKEELLRNDYREEIGFPMTYRAQRVVVKWAVQVAKRLADGRLGERLGIDFDGNKRCFGKR